MKEKDLGIITIRGDAELTGALNEAAKQENRSRNWIIVRLLREGMGLDPPKESLKYQNARPAPVLVAAAPAKSQHAEGCHCFLCRSKQ